MADRVDAGNERVGRSCRRCRALAARPLPINIVGRMCLVLGKCVQDIREHQFLVLLLVM